MENQTTNTTPPTKAKKSINWVKLSLIWLGLFITGCGLLFLTGKTDLIAELSLFMISPATLVLFVYKLFHSKNMGARIFWIGLLTFEVVVLLACRSEYHTPIIWIWKWKGVFIIAIGLLLLLYPMWKKKKNPEAKTKRIFVILKLSYTVTVIALIASWPTEWTQNRYHEGHMWWLCNHIHRIELNETQLPYTGKERIQPRINITTMGYEKLSNAIGITIPHLIHDRFCDSTQDIWSLASQPSTKHSWQPWMDHIDEVFMVPANVADPDLADHRIKKVFTVGPTMRLDNNTTVAATKALGWRYFYMEPDTDDPRFMHDDQGNLVEVVPLIYWTGFLFPKPVFGGVIVIPAGEQPSGTGFKALFTGRGYYLSPKECHQRPYLKNNNLLPEKIARLYAESFSYLEGYYDARINKKNAIEVPHLAHDQNEYPFVTNIVWKSIELKQKDGSIIKPADGLYDYFGLEPIGADNSALVLSLFIPADGNNIVYYYDHGKRDEGLSGITSMPGKIKTADSHIDWSHMLPVEFRPYIPEGIPELKGSRNFFWLTTVLAVSSHDDSTGKYKFDGSATPKIVVCNARRSQAVLLDAQHPEKWVDSLRSFCKNQYPELFKNSTPVKDTIKVLPVVAPTPSDTTKH